MGLRELAEADLSSILEDSVYGFGWDVKLISPSGSSIDFVGFSNDISQIVDPETGQVVSGRQATVAFRNSSLKAKGIELPQGESDASKKPWLVEFSGISGLVETFKVVQSNPDRTIGVTTCLLELYKI